MINFGAKNRHQALNEEKSNENFHEPKKPNRHSFEQVIDQPTEDLKISNLLPSFTNIPKDDVELYSNSDFNNFTNIKDALTSKEGYSNLSNTQASKMPQFTQIKSFFDKLSINPLSRSQNTSKASDSTGRKYNKFMSMLHSSSELELNWIFGSDVDQNWWFEFPEALDTQNIISADIDSESESEDQTPNNIIYRDNFSAPSSENSANTLINKQFSEKSVPQKKSLSLPIHQPIKQSQKPGRGLPPRIIAIITQYLTLHESIQFLSLKRSWFLSFLSNQGLYKNIFWRLMLARVGFSSIIKKVKGEKKTVLLNAPRCMWGLFTKKFGINDANDLKEIVSADPLLLFCHIFKEFHKDYLLFTKYSNQISILYKFIEVKTDKKKLVDFGQRLEQLLWFGRGSFYHDYKTINWNLYKTADFFEKKCLYILEKSIEVKDLQTAHVYAHVLSVYKCGTLYVNMYLESNPLVLAGSNLELMGFENSQVFDFLKPDVDLNKQHAFIRWKSHNINDHLELKTLFIVITDMLNKEFCLQEKIVGALENESLVRTSISALLNQLLKADGVIGISFRTLFDSQRLKSHNNVSFLSTVSEAFKIFLKYIKIWDQFFYFPHSNIENKKNRKHNRNFYSLIPKSIPLSSMFTVLSKKQMLDYFDIEKQNINDGMQVALDWFKSGMSRLTHNTVLTQKQQIFFSNEIIEIFGFEELEFNSPILEKINSPQNGHSGFVDNINTPQSTKFIKFFNFADHSESIEIYKIKVTRIFFQIFGFTALNKVKDLEYNPSSKFLEDTIQDFRKSEAHSRSFEVQTDSDLQKKTSFFENSHNILVDDKNSVYGKVRNSREDNSKSGFYNSNSISTLLCISLIYFTNTSIERILLFCNTPKDSLIYKNARKQIEYNFCELLKNLGQNHIQPAFGEILKDLQQLQSQIGTISGLVTAVKIAASQRRVSKYENTQEKSNRKPSATDETLNNQNTSKIPGFSNKSRNTLQKINFSSISLDFALSSNESILEQQMREIVSVLELKFFELVHYSDLILQIVNEYYQIKMGSFIDPNDFLNPVHVQKQALNNLIDDCVASGVDSIIEIIIRQLEHVLSIEQTEEDYCPKQTVSLQLKPTIACVHCVQLLSEASEIIKSLSKAQKIVCDVYMSEIGNRLFSLLLKHLFTFTISEPGGFQLISDLNLYYDWAVSNLDDLDTLQCFTTLKDLANCFIIAPKDLRGFLRELYSRRAFDNVLRGEEVYDIVARRADYKKIRSQVEGNCDFM
ncbi:hypothetical protein BB561_000389 [Smittium simulii]|uniref:Exocyst complex component Sec10-like alpha-helical bundle domain-containing protein n=1 Tax=Smittium simulii TaxID=133385 RepID=A0A2T9YZE8_9FUNG|nr:hypothetical protein BB561_000389 [Smittium simulii]